MAEVDMVCDDDERADKLGAKLAEMLHLRRDSEHKDRWQTTWGSKTNAGLARSILRVLQEEAETMEQKYYDVFHRTFWKDNPSGQWPNGLEPHKGEREYIERHVTYADARRLCQEYNSTHEPGRYSDKAEFEEAD